MRGARRYKKKQLCLYFFTNFPLVLCSIWRAGRPTSVGQFDEITLDAVKVCIAEQGEEEDERIGE